MKKIAAYFLGASLSLMPITSYAETKGVDWTPLFKSWENQCSHNPKLDALIKSMVPTPMPNVGNANKNTKFRVKKLNLPVQYQSAIFNNPMIKMHNGKNDAGYYEVILSTSGYYYGMPLVNINLAAGLENGIHVQSITVDMPVDKVRNILSKKANIRYEAVEDYPVGTDEDNVYEQIGIDIYKDDKNPSRTHIMCDYST